MNIPHYSVYKGDNNMSNPKSEEYFYGILHDDEEEGQFVGEDEIKTELDDVYEEDVDNNMSNPQHEYYSRGIVHFEVEGQREIKTELEDMEEGINNDVSDTESESKADLQAVRALTSATRGNVQRVRTRAGRGRGRGGPPGLGSARPSAGFDMFMGDIASLPQADGLKTPMTIKRRRTWRPDTSRKVSPPPAAEPAPSPTPATLLQVGAGPSWEVPISVAATSSAAATEIDMLPPSSAAFVKCAGSGPSTSLASKLSQTARRRFSRSAENEDEFGFFGSDDEQDDDTEGDEAAAASVLFPRTLRDFFPTDMDEELPQPLESFPPASADSLLPGPLYHFEWRSFPDPPIPMDERRETFSRVNCGPTAPFTDPIDSFMSIWDRDIMEHIAVETNRYAQQLASKMIADGTLSPRSRIKDWKDTTVDELYVYFAIVLATGVVVKSRLEEYWGSEADIFVTPGFRVHMSLARFVLLSKCLHFSNNDTCTRNLDASAARLHKIMPIVDHLNDRFSALYNLGQNIALDESLTQWKGWLDINQFIPNKAASVGIKTYEICESQTGYLWRFEVHALNTPPPATQEATPISGTTPTLVLRLLQGLEFKGHTVWMDNFYNSPALARTLKSLGFDCVGTLRTNRQFVPIELATLTKSEMVVGEMYGCTSGDVDLMVWRDHSRVGMVSTYHGNCVSVDESVPKPALIRDYNICMGGVDKKDQMLAMYPIERKRTRVWYKKFFRRLLNVSVLNSYILYKASTPHTRVKTHRQFRAALCAALLARHGAPAPAPARARVPPAALAAGLLHVASHRPAEYPLAQGSHQRRRRKCVLCGKRTQTYCTGCDKAMCVFTCYPDYPHHTQTLHTYT